MQNALTPLRSLSNRLHSLHWMPLALGLVFFSIVFEGVAEPWSAIYEAEDATIIAPAEIVDADNAVNKKAVRISTTKQERIARLGNTAENESHGIIAFPIHPPERGLYHVWVRLQWHCVCSPSILLDTSGKDYSESIERNSVYRPGFITSTARPLVWHWVKAGIIEFEKGEQEIKLRQRGHLTLIDAISISADESYQPPGYVDTESIISINALLLKETSETPINQSLTEDPIGDMKLSATFDLTSNAPSTLMRSLRFCDDEKGNFYEVRLLKNLNDTLSTSLIKSTSDSTSVLRSSIDSNPKNKFCTLQVIRRKDTIDVYVNGEHLLEQKDNSFTSGMISVNGSGGNLMSVYDIEIQQLETATDFFNQGAEQWKVVSGDWNTIEPEVGIISNASHYLGKANALGVTYSPWLYTDNFTLKSLLQPLSNGRAGLVFNGTSEGEGWSVVLNTQSDQSMVELIHFSPKTITRFWSIPIETPKNQWHELQIQKSGARLHIQFDNQDLGSLEHQDWVAAGRTGLLVSDQGIAYFSSTEILNSTVQPTTNFSFEPGVGHHSFSQWEPAKGVYEVHQHPGRLELHPQKNKTQSKLTLTRTVRLPLKVSLWLQHSKYANQSTAVAATELALPGLSLPVLPGDPRIGFELKCLAPNGPTFTCLVDTETVRELRVQQDTSILINAKRIPKNSRQKVPELLEFILTENAITAEIIEHLKEQKQVDNQEWMDAEWQVSLVGKNLDSDQMVILKHIVVDQLPHYLSPQDGETR